MVGPPQLTLTTPLNDLSGFGPSRVELLARLGLHTVRDLLLNFPRDYEDLSDLRTIEDLEEGIPCSVQGVVEETDLRNLGPGKSMLGVLVRQGRRAIRAVYFNQPFLQGKFLRGQPVVLEGKPRVRGGAWEMMHPQVRMLESADERVRGRVLPVYRLTEGINQGQMRRLMRSGVEQTADLLDEVLPEGYRRQHDLPTIHQAARWVHLPQTRQELEIGRRRFVFQELLVLQLALALKRQQHGTSSGPTQAGSSRPQVPQLVASAKVDARIKQLFPFELTAGQQQAIAEVAADLAGRKPMNRLLQADVGSGKTVIAIYTLLVAVAHGYQAALMAPTEVLARQHWRTLEGLLPHSRVRRTLLVGSLSAPQRRDILERLATGQIDLVVGTQALLNQHIQFTNLAVVVIDEQHKFGVRQRATLRQAGLAPHSLVMTATPIPRSLGLTLYGDLDITTIRDRPVGRAKVHTYFEPADSPNAELRRQQWWQFLRRKLDEGRQAYIITPRVSAAIPDETAYCDTPGDQASGDQVLNHAVLSQEQNRVDQPAETQSTGNQPGDALLGKEQKSDGQPAQDCEAKNEPTNTQALANQGVRLDQGDLQPGDLQPGDLQPGDLQLGDLQLGDRQPGNDQQSGGQLGDSQQDLGFEEVEGEVGSRSTGIGAEQLYEALQAGPLSGYRLGLLHGRIPAEQKEATLRAFAEGTTQVLVATTVVEVGLDVPNATLMTIEDGHLFGLATLHQLRGRIGRSTFPGFCCVFGSPTDDAARERLRAFTQTTDGFELAEVDFRLRGPGNLLGTQQSGMPPLVMADLARDVELLGQLRQEAERLVNNRPLWSSPPWAGLRQIVSRIYGEVLDFGDVG